MANFANNVICEQTKLGIITLSKYRKSADIFPGNGTVSLYCLARKDQPLAYCSLAGSLFFSRGNNTVSIKQKDLMQSSASIVSLLRFFQRRFSAAVFWDFNTKHPISIWQSVQIYKGCSFDYFAEKDENSNRVIIVIFLCWQTVNNGGSWKLVWFRCFFLTEKIVAIVQYQSEFV